MFKDVLLELEALAGVEGSSATQVFSRAVNAYRECLAGIDAKGMVSEEYCLQCIPRAFADKLVAHNPVNAPPGE